MASAPGTWSRFASAPSRLPTRTIAEACGLVPNILWTTIMRAAPQKEKEFFPRGAVAFFGLMIAFFSVVWLLFYALMIQRH